MFRTNKVRHINKIQCRFVALAHQYLVSDCSITCQPILDGMIKDPWMVRFGLLIGACGVGCVPRHETTMSLCILSSQYDSYRWTVQTKSIFYLQAFIGRNPSSGSVEILTEKAQNGTIVVNVAEPNHITTAEPIFSQKYNKPHRKQG